MRVFTHTTTKWRSAYNRDNWVLCTCTLCGRANFVEPHGTTARCRCAIQWTEHESIPQSARDFPGLRVSVAWLREHRARKKRNQGTAA